MRNKYLINNAFTLAEILIVLAIIGVIASLTIPALLANIQNQILRTQWKEAYSIIEQSNKRALTDYSGDFTDTFLNITDMKDKLKNYFNYTKECPASASSGECWPSTFYDKNGNTSSWTSQPGIVLNNGMFVRFYYGTASSTSCTDTQYYTTGACGAYEVDINGFKGPNVIGEDIFFIHILANEIKPAGVPESRYSMSSANCATDGPGCGALYLRQ
jgi:prepilin-type N-terminal cleavage/methylation domain-containing protein